MCSAKFGLIAVVLAVSTMASAADWAPVTDLAAQQSSTGSDEGAFILPAPANQSQSATETVPSLPSVDTSSLSVKQRLNRLEQQVNNLTQMNLPQQVAQLQQQVQQLAGQMDEMSQQQQHVEALPDQPSPAAIAASPKKSSAPATDSAAYQNAFNLLADKQWDSALLGFQDYLKKHPDGQFVANAHYWLGEIYLQKRNLKQAELEFNWVVKEYSTSQKVADAQLKLAILHAQQGKTDQARKELQTVKQRYPGTTAARLADIQLKKLQNE